MNKKRFVGFALVAVGILTGLSRLALTGAVIGEPQSSFVGIGGALITIAGLLLVLASRYSASDLA
jgi:hypothetical protein